MKKIKLYQFQKDILKDTRDMNRVAYYMDMGMGKTFVGSEKIRELGNTLNLIVCQKSKVKDWMEHFYSYYPDYHVFDLTRPKELKIWQDIDDDWSMNVGVVNYDLIFRRDFNIIGSRAENTTLLLDESSLIQHENTERARAILKLSPKCVILLSGTPCNGTYETLWSQLKLLGWNIPKKAYWNTYVDYRIDKSQGFPLVIVNGYKRVDRLKDKLNEYGCRFLKSADVLELPEQMHMTVNVPLAWGYKEFWKKHITTAKLPRDDVEQTIVGDTPLTRLLGARELCGMFNEYKYESFRNLVESTSERLIVFYNFNAELEELTRCAKQLERPISIVNGKTKDLDAYENKDNSVTFIQYQAGAYGLNLQKACRIIYFTPPLSSEMFEQSKKRIHRIGQNQRCYYYYLTCENSVEELIYATLAKKKNYTEVLFEHDNQNYQGF